MGMFWTGFVGCAKNNQLILFKMETNKEDELKRIGVMIGCRRQDIIKMEDKITQYKLCIMKRYEEIQHLEQEYHKVKQKWNNR
jgi:hypothetical protein